MGEGEGGMFQENSIETCILSRVKQITSQGWMHETALGPGALGKPRGSGWRGRWEGGSGWGTHVNPWLFHFNVWQNPPQIKKKKRKNIKMNTHTPFTKVHQLFRICNIFTPSPSLSLSRALSHTHTLYRYTQYIHTHYIYTIFWTV